MGSGANRASCPDYRGVRVHHQPSSWASRRLCGSPVVHRKRCRVVSRDVAHFPHHRTRLPGQGNIREAGQRGSPLSRQSGPLLENPAATMRAAVRRESWATLAPGTEELRCNWQDPPRDWRESHSSEPEPCRVRQDLAASPVRR